MEKRIIVWLAVLISLMIYSCTGEADNTPTEPGNDFESAVLEKEVTSVTGIINHPDIVAQRDNYQVVIQDDDGWEIMLILRKRKKIAYESDSVLAYYGHMYYKTSSYLIRGFATALYDQRSGVISISAKDSAWNRGNINYSFTLNNEVPTETGSDRWKLDGGYWYYKWPFRMNAIKGRLIKGYFKGFTPFPYKD